MLEARKEGLKEEDTKNARKLVEKMIMKVMVQQPLKHSAHIACMNLKMHRIKLDLSQRELSAATGLSIKQIQKYENCVNDIASETLYKIAQLFGTLMKLLFKLESILSRCLRRG